MKPRNREINIFNMSLLDVLCGALGAFCFLMLALFPYYTKAGGSAAGNPEDTNRQKQELDKARADLQKALEQMSHMSQGQPVDVQQLMQQIEAARQREQQALQRLQQNEQGLNQTRGQMQQLERQFQQLASQAGTVITVVATWDNQKAGVEMWVRDPEKTWDGPKKETPDGAKLRWQSRPAPGIEFFFQSGASVGRYEFYYRIAGQGAPRVSPLVNPFLAQQNLGVLPVVVRAAIVRLDVREKITYANSWFLNKEIVEEKKLVPAFIVAVDNKGQVSVDHFPETQR